MIDLLRSERRKKENVQKMHIVHSNHITSQNKWSRKIVPTYIVHTPGKKPTLKKIKIYLGFCKNLFSKRVTGGGHAGEWARQRGSRAGRKKRKILSNLMQSSSSSVLTFCCSFFLLHLLFFTVHLLFHSVHCYAILSRFHKKSSSFFRLKRLNHTH